MWSQGLSRVIEQLVSDRLIISIGIGIGPIFALLVDYRNR
jgi:hypothetical protein